MMGVPSSGCALVEGEFRRSFDVHAHHWQFDAVTGAGINRGSLVSNAAPGDRRRRVHVEGLSDERRVATTRRGSQLGRSRAPCWRSAESVARAIAEDNPGKRINILVAGDYVRIHTEQQCRLTGRPWSGSLGILTNATCSSSKCRPFRDASRHAPTNTFGITGILKPFPRPAEQRHRLPLKTASGIPGKPTYSSARVSRPSRKGRISSSTVAIRKDAKLPAPGLPGEAALLFRVECDVSPRSRMLIAFRDYPPRLREQRIGQSPHGARA